MEEILKSVVTLGCQNLKMLAISAFVLLLGASYVYYDMKFRYWSRQGVGGPRPVPYFGNLLDMFFTQQHTLDKHRVDRFGRIHGFYEGSNPVLAVADPVVLKQILVKDFSNFFDKRPVQLSNPVFTKFLVNLSGDDWRSSRHTLTPTFTSGKIKAMYTLMIDCSKNLEAALASKAKDGQEVDLKHLYGCYTMDVIAKCCFAMDTNAFKDPTNLFVKNASAFFVTSSLRVFLFFVLPDFMKKQLGINLIGNDVSGFFESVALSVIRKRQKEGPNGIKHNDFVELLMEANASQQSVEPKSSDHLDHHLNEGKDEKDENEKQFNSSRIKKKQMSELEMVAQSVLFLAAGYETTGSLLTYSSYAMALNQDVQERLHQEIKSIFNDQGEIEYDQMIKNSYLDAFITETLRMFDPAIRLERKADEEYTLEGKDITIPKGGLVYIPVYAIHHDAQFYPQPEKFDPTRFLPENRHKLTPYTYLPFGAGPRNCIGMRFALVEAKLALVKLVSKFKFIKSKNTEDPPTFGGSKFLLQMNSAIVKAVVR